MNQPDNWPQQAADHHVVVLGASPKPTRYANQAQRLLMEHGYRVTPVHPKINEIEGLAVTHALADVEAPVHTLAMYIGPQRSELVIEGIVALRPARVIFNPGTESDALQAALVAQGCDCIIGCTLVMLRTGQF